MDNLNFPLILVLATLMSGVIWLIDTLAFAPDRRKRAEAVLTLRKRKGLKSVDLDDEELTDAMPREPLLVEYARSFFPVLLIVLVLRSFVFEPFRIPSGSMIPTLLVGDFILVSKYSYGLRLPVVNTKILDTGSPRRGDVAVFRYPLDPRQDYIKRVVGLPGDKIEYRNKQFFINGKPVTISGDSPYQPAGSNATEAGILRRQEQLGVVEHDILIHSRGGLGESSWEVPHGHYFMVGDNRDNSNDSRVWGFVPEENLVGKAKFIWMHWKNGIIWSRLGNSIK